MERLTTKRQLKYGTANCLSTEYVSRPIASNGDEIVFGKAIDRLAAYEDTGYEPGQFETAMDAIKAHLWDVEQELKAYKDTGLTPTEIVHADKMLKDNWEMPLERLKEAIDLINTKDDGRLAVSRFKHGDCVWVIERDEDGEALDVAGSMFLAEVLGFVIVSAYINDMTVAEETLSYHMQETVENYDTTLMVFPSEDVYQTKAEAETTLREAAENA